VTRSTPVQEFTSSTNWKQSAGGYRHNAAIKTDGTLWLWGRNSFGQLGINDLVSRSTPVQEFTSSTNWKQVSAGGYHVGSVKTGINIDTGYSS
jgi:alpha-tubulin suppressor-like RCC1 family protein